MVHAAVWRVKCDNDDGGKEEEKEEEEEEEEENAAFSIIINASALNACRLPRFSCANCSILAAKWILYAP
jgi:hypothetical protein